MTTTRIPVSPDLKAYPGSSFPKLLPGPASKSGDRTNPSTDEVCTHPAHASADLLGLSIPTRPHIHFSPVYRPLSHIIGFQKISTSALQILEASELKPNRRPQNKHTMYTHYFLPEIRPSASDSKTHTKKSHFRFDVNNPLPSAPCFASQGRRKLLTFPSQVLDFTLFLSFSPSPDRSVSFALSPLVTLSAFVHVATYYRSETSQFLCTYMH